jgi:hypothetical protein
MPRAAEWRAKGDRGGHAPGEGVQEALDWVGALIAPEEDGGLAVVEDERLAAGEVLAPRAKRPSSAG